MSWNVYGGDTNLMMQAMIGTVVGHAGVNLNLDLVVLEEAVNAPTNPHFYNPITTLTTNHGYALVGPILENIAVRVIPGTTSRLYAAQGVNRSYVVLYRTAVINTVAAGLLDWLGDANLQPPNNAFDAAQEGFNQRPPLVVTFTHSVGAANNPMTLFAWHAPTGHYNHASLDMLNASARLANAQLGAGRVIIAGDLNNNDVGPWFGGFNGIQDDLDYVMANFGATADLTGVVAGSAPVLNQLWGDAHPAIAAQINY
jgi:hypothetical protein